MSDAVHIDAEGLGAAAAEWRADVPGAVPYEFPTDVKDAASASVLAAMADWPVEHALMATHRAGAASQLNTAANIATGILTAADDQGAALIAKEA